MPKSSHNILGVMEQQLEGLPVTTNMFGQQASPGSQ